MKYKGNYIKSLFSSKVGSLSIKDKKLSFQIVERSLTTSIENKIKESDKAFLYSYKLKDSNNAKMYIKFEKLVNSEVVVSEMKDELTDTISVKIDWLNNLIEGYVHITKFYQDTITLMRKIKILENKLNSLIKQNQGNIYYLKMLSILFARLYSDPLSSSNIEQGTTHKNFCLFLLIFVYFCLFF